MLESFAKLKDSLLKMQDKATERSYYHHLCNFIDEYSASLGYKDVFATSEESSKVNDNSVGFPDITIRDKNRLIGWIEVKLPNDSLSSEKFHDQFKKYKDSLENIILTNFREWQLWQWDDKNEPKLITEISFDPTNFTVGSENKFQDFFEKFIEGVAYEVKTPKQLAIALAKKTRFLSKQVEEAFNPGNKDSELYKLRCAFEKTLIQSISDHQFANMVAETLSYSLFLSSLEHFKGNPDKEFTLRTAIDYLPTNIPILSDLYSLVERVTSVHPNILHASQLLIDQINNSNIEKIYYKLIEHKPGEDPVIQFYEPFLAEYDPKEREARGVYYTPKPVVDYIVRSVDYILKEKFAKKEGLADPSVNILDPATGTGTFLMSAIQEIHQKIEKENSSLGGEMIQKKFNEIVVDHILKHFYGFELMVAPYAVAHLKLTLLLSEFGFDFNSTLNDGDLDNDRFKIYLANTLDDPNKPPQFDLPGFHSISEETKKANNVKNDVPILAILGNPPYSVSSSNKSAWIEQLMSSYKTAVRSEERNIQPLSDDYIKFIRFAQWKIERTGQGIFAMITNHSFLSGKIHRGMREELLQTYDAIYVLDLHGNLTTENNDTNDQNVFNIRQGVSISFFLKSVGIQKGLWYSEIWGPKSDKFYWLNSNNFDSTSWKPIPVKSPNFFFVQTDDTYFDEYEEYTEINKIFNLYSNGVKTHRDILSVGFDKQSLLENYSDLKYDFQKTIQKMKLKETRNFNEKSILQLNYDDVSEDIREIQYRPFDYRYLIFNDHFVDRPRKPIMDNMVCPNIGMILANQFGSKQHFICFCSNKIIEISSQPFAAYNIFPLNIYTTTRQNQLGMLDDKMGGNININSEFIEKFSSVLDDQLINENNKISPSLQIFYYIYAILHCPTYRERYKSQLKINFPRIPVTSNPEIFKRLSEKGNQLVNLHLIGDNPFDKSETIFSNSEKWNLKIGGHCPESLLDWKVTEVRYSDLEKRVYINPGQYFEGIEKEVWEFMVGGYQVCEKWLKDRKKTGRCLSADDLTHYMKIVVSLRETIRIMKEIDALIPEWPLK